MSNLFKTTAFIALLLLTACGSKEDDSNPTYSQLSASAVSKFEGSAGNVNFDFKVRLSQASTKDVSVDFATKDKSAKAGEDYIANAGHLNFAPGETEKTISIVIVADTLGEYDEEFEFLLSNPVNALLTTLSVIGTIRNDDGPVPPGSDGYITPESYAGYNVVWQDEFNGTAIDPANWIHETGPNWFNNELQNYTDRPVNSFISNGKLVIVAKKENLEGREYTSARMITKDLHEFRYGRIDIRAKLPTGQGIWPALWMLGSNIDDVSWPKCGEIDNMEMIGKEPSTLYGTIHWDNNGSHADYGGSTNLASGIFADEFHVFTIIWNNQQIKWLLDDVQFHVVDITPAELSEFHQDYFLIFNVAVGGDWPGNPDATTVFPQQMEVDYVRVFQQ
ncbi:MAG: family 16 glycosylhydrolase [Saprospiraceae bacterium]|nr:family 16 glycosylhydrolase [Saprospiraceae bacterium]MCF8252721.1 family 16 glycosylhydrolase [Saprospiraceae bacterium]MCF8282945.1 family 16 glycosylhydrolase [Bacteroidales bacterium]MCF8314290.1 family 16 glycosylhydrolase [Saprospiraceae bacterium]MCF8443119.1 family 16 glycosylhydrolase [Saprospiraceae bacterium]